MHLSTSLERLEVKRFTLTCLFMAMSAVLSSTAASAQSLGLLNLTNGDTVPGTLDSIDSANLKWKSTLSTDPITYDRSSVSAVTWDAPSTLLDEVMWKIELTTGDILLGQLKSVGEAGLTFESGRHGSLTLERSKVRRLYQVTRGATIYAGPRGLSGWTVPELPNAFGKVFVEDGLQFKTNFPGTLFKSLNLPERYQVKIELYSSDIPRFTLSLDSDHQKRLNMQLEVWQNTLVAMSNYKFIEVATLDPKQHSLFLNLYVDRPAGRMIICDHAGKQLAELKATPSTSNDGNPGIVLQCSRGDLMLRRLQVQQWDGSSIEPIVILGETAGTAEELTVTKRTETIKTTLADLKEIEINSLSNDENKTADVQVVWNEGEVIRGILKSCVDGKIEIAVPYSREPITSTLQDVQQVRMLNSVKTEELLADKATTASGQMTGALVFGPETPLGWKGFGVQEVIPLSLDADTTITRPDRSSTTTAPPEFDDILYLTDGSVVPANITHMDSTVVKFKSPLISITELTPNSLQAVEFSAMRDPNRSKEVEWKTIAGLAKITQEQIDFEDNGQVQHPEIVDGDEIHFQLNWPKAYVNFDCELFEVGQADVGSTKLHFTLMNGHLSVQNEDQYRMNKSDRFYAHLNPNHVRVKKNRADISLVLENGQINVIANGKSLMSAPLDRMGFDGHALSMKVEYVDEMSEPQPRDDSQKRKDTVIVSNFKVHQTRGAFVKQFIHKQSREHALIIPRFRRDSPPANILVAHNGDLLRGDLKLLAGDKFHFEAKQETYKIPRDTVAAVVWMKLDPLVEDDDEAAKQPVVQDKTPAQLPSSAEFKTGDGYVLRMHPLAVEKGSIVGSHPVLGDCTVPVDVIEVVTIGYPNKEIQGEYISWIPSRSPEPRWDQVPQEESVAVEQLVGRKMEDFELTTFDGAKFKLSEHENKIVVLDFWASWCGPCVQALPKYIDVTSKYSPDDVIFVAVNLREDPKRIREFLTARPLEVTPMIALDFDGKMADTFRVQGIPHTVVLEKGNVMRFMHLGYTTGVENRLKEELDQLLKIKEPAAAAE